MKTFKLIDFWISVFLIVVFTILSLVNQDETVFAAYFIVGGWQVISMIIHMIKKWLTHKGGIRRNYHILVAIIILLGLPPFVYITFFIYWVMLFISPIMAVFYTSICYSELKQIARRPLDIVL